MRENCRILSYRVRDVSDTIAVSWNYVDKGVPYASHGRKWISVFQTSAFDRLRSVEQMLLMSSVDCGAYHSQIQFELQIIIRRRLIPVSMVDVKNWKCACTTKYDGGLISSKKCAYIIST